MIPYNVIIEKQQFYANEKLRLQSFDINAEVDRRLQTTRQEIKNEVIKELANDMQRCDNYLELLSELAADNIIAEKEEDKEETNEAVINEDSNEGSYTDDSNYGG